MLTTEERINLIKRIDFGEIDGYGEPNLEKYFLDDGYWNKIITNNIFYVIGKKGTGKSSIYRMIAEQGLKKGDIIENKDFGSFPFEKLLALSDDNFTMPNQYQSIWKNLVLNIFSTMIAKIPVTDNIYHEKITEYVTKCVGDVVELHKELINYTDKTNHGLNFKGINYNHEGGRTISIGNGSNNVSQINTELYQLIYNFFMTYNQDIKFIIQFDRLDDNYNQYQNATQYYQAIISLFKTVYQINQDFRFKNINNAKIVLYLRSDIYRELSNKDAESARWDDFKIDINWSIINKNDWNNPKLMQMIDKRIQVSLPELGTDASFKNLFDNPGMRLINEDGYVEDVFKYIITRTMHRPRDLVQFCKCIKKEINETHNLYFRTIKNAEKAYSYWLVNKEIANEINPILKNTEPVYEMLKLIGSRSFSLTDFYDRYRSVKGIDMDREKLALYLYDIGIIQNIDTNTSPPSYRSIIRNEGKLDKNMKIIIHTGVWKGLTV